MVLFSYHAADRQGKMRQGVLFAEDREEATRLLEERHLWMSSLKQGSLPWNRPRLSPTQKEQLFQQLSHLLEAGMPLYESLCLLEEDAQKGKSHSIFLFLSEQVRKGSSLAESVHAMQPYFSEEESALIHCGETSGSLKEILDYLEKMLREKRQLKSRCLQALLYPGVVFFLSLVALGVLFLFALPSLQSLFGEEALEGGAGVVFTFSEWLHDYGMFASPVLVCAVAFLWHKGSLWWHIFAFRIPLLGAIFKKQLLVHYCLSLAPLLRGGVALPQALFLARKTIKNRIFARGFAEVEKEVISGKRLSEALRSVPHIPLMMQRMLRVGEESGSLAGMLEHVAEYYQQELQLHLKQMMTLLPPLILVGTGIIVAFVMMSVLIPLTDVHHFIH